MLQLAAFVNPKHVCYNLLLILQMQNIFHSLRLGQHLESTEIICHHMMTPSPTI